MKPNIHVAFEAPSTWAVRFEDGAAICQIKLSISSMLNGSRYYVIVDDLVSKEGTFNFGVWDDATARDLLSRLVRSMYPDAAVTVQASRGGDFVPAAA
jgi:hypothetical protein